MKKHLFIHFIILLLTACVMATPVCASTTAVKGGTKIGNARSVSLGASKTYVVRMTKTRENYWYKFKTSSDSRFYTITVKNCNKGGQMVFYLTDRYEDSLKAVYLWAGDSRDFDIKLKKSTTYYLRFVNYGKSGSGNIKFNIKSRKDTVGDTLRSAKAIVKGRTCSGTLDGSSDVDFYKFKPAVSGTYRFVVKNCNYKENMIISVMDRYEDILGSGYYYLGTGTTFTVKLTRNSWYYVRFKGNGRTGTYKLTVRKP